MDKIEQGARRPHRLLAPLRLAFGLSLGLAASACASSGEDPSGCTPGTATGCPSGQICSAQGVCEATNNAVGGLVLSADGARACEILLESDSAAVARVVPGAGVEAVLRARPPRYAIALASAGGALAPDAASLEVSGAPSAVTVSKVECFDDSGAPLAAASARID